jgi:hypothetical protein
MKVNNSEKVCGNSKNADTDHFADIRKMVNGRIFIAIYDALLQIIVM